MPEIDQTQPVLADDEVDRRLLLLAALHHALHELGISCYLTRRHKLVLRDWAKGPHEPSGLTDPELFVFLACGCRHVTTDGASYRLGSDKFPVRDPAAAAVAICAIQPAPSV